MELKDKMIRYRAKHKLSQKAFADLVGVSTQTICTVETGQQTPKATTKAMIEMILEKEDRENEG